MSNSNDATEVIFQRYKDTFVEFYLNEERECRSFNKRREEKLSLDSSFFLKMLSVPQQVHPLRLAWVFRQLVEDSLLKAKGNPEADDLRLNVFPHVDWDEIVQKTADVVYW